MAVHPLDAVRGPQASKPVPLHDPREASALAGSRHVDVFHFLEGFDGERLAFGQVGWFTLPDLADVAFGFRIDLLRMAAFGLSGAFSLLVVEAQLHGVIAVALFGPNQEHR